MGDTLVYLSTCLLVSPIHLLSTGDMNRTTQTTRVCGRAMAHSATRRPQTHAMPAAPHRSGQTARASLGTLALIMNSLSLVLCPPKPCGWKRSPGCRGRNMRPEPRTFASRKATQGSAPTPRSSRSASARPDDTSTRHPPPMIVSPGAARGRGASIWGTGDAACLAPVPGSESAG